MISEGNISSAAGSPNAPTHGSTAQRQLFQEGPAPGRTPLQGRRRREPMVEKALLKHTHLGQMLPERAEG